MAEEKMVDLDTTGEGQEVELQEEESTKEKKVEEEKVEVTSEEKAEESKDEEESKDDGLDKYSKNVQRRIKKLLDRFEKSEQREAEAIKFAESAKKKVQEAEEKEDWRNLYEDTKAERDQFKVQAEKFQQIESARKDRILESFPENLREKMSALDSDTLEQMKTELNNKVPQVDNSGGGVSGGKTLSWKDMNPKDRRKNFADIMRFKK